MQTVHGHSSAEAPGDFQHVPVHLILTLANVAIGDAGTKQRNDFKSLLARDLAAASDLESCAFHIASLQETSSKAVATRSRGVQGQDSIENASRDDEVADMDEDGEVSPAKFCFSGGDLQESTTRCVTVRAEIEIWAQGASDTLRRRGLCAESIVAVRNPASTDMELACRFVD